MLKRSVTGEPIEDHEAQGVRAYVAAIIHSKALEDMEMLARGLLVVDHGKDGLILALEDVEHQSEEEILQKAQQYGAPEVLDMSGRIIIPGLIDTHAHAPQYAFTGTGMNLPLLKWLETYTFPCEAKFADLTFAKDIYNKSVRRHLMNGTTTCSYFATLHLPASKLLVDIVRQQGQRAYVGKVSMDRNSPDFYVEKTEDGILAAREFVKYTQDVQKPRLHRAESMGNYTDADTSDPESDDSHDELSVSTNSKGEATTSTTPVTAGTSEGAPALVTPVITPRFVPSCTPEMLQALGKIADQYQLPVQSHLSESQGEIAWVRELHPECSSYADVYRTYGLLHERAFFAHCCHCGGDEQEMLKAHEAGVAHCPSSNFMLGSGVLNVRRLLKKGIKVGLGTDVAGGYSTSVLDALRQAIIASRCVSFTERDEDSKPYEALSHKEAFYLATQGGAEVLGLGKKVGNFMPGKYFDAVVVDAGTEHGPLDLFDGEELEHAFEKFLFLGDDRNIEKVFVGGKQVI